MNTNVIKLVAGIAWAGVAVASASPVSAKAVTSQAGYYAACSGQYVVQAHQCIQIQFNYSQQIRFINAPCNSGACSSDRDTHVEAPYGTGRKAATSMTSCGLAVVYELGDCAC